MTCSKVQTTSEAPHFHDESNHRPWNTTRLNHAPQTHSDGSQLHSSARSFSPLQRVPDFSIAFIRLFWAISQAIGGCLFLQKSTRTVAHPVQLPGGVPHRLRPFAWQPFQHLRAKLVLRPCCTERQITGRLRDIRRCRLVDHELIAWA
jgi:hypothetical protein